MPTYAYQCENCGAEIEIVQKMSDAPLTKCEACGGKLQKRMFPVGIVFKGSGFYVNDYAKKGEPAASATIPAPAASETEATTPAPAAAPKKDDAATPPATPAPTTPASSTTAATDAS
jgi:putative FmdB family regulatory protein